MNQNSEIPQSSIDAIQSDIKNDVVTPEGVGALSEILSGADISRMPEPKIRDYVYTELLNVHQIPKPLAVDITFSIVIKLDDLGNGISDALLDALKKVYVAGLATCVEAAEFTVGTDDRELVGRAVLNMVRVQSYGNHN